MKGCWGKRSTTFSGNVCLSMWLNIVVIAFLLFGARDFTADALDVLAVRTLLGTAFDSRGPLSPVGLRPVLSASRKEWTSWLLSENYYIYDSEVPPRLRPQSGSPYLEE